MCATWKFSGNSALEAELCFWSCCDPVDRAGSVYLKVDKAEVGQHGGV